MVLDEPLSQSLSMLLRLFQVLGSLLSGSTYKQFLLPDLPEAWRFRLPISQIFLAFSWCIFGLLVQQNWFKHEPIMNPAGIFRISAALRGLCLTMLWTWWRMPCRTLTWFPRWAECNDIEINREFRGYLATSHKDEIPNTPNFSICVTEVLAGFNVLYPARFMLNFFGQAPDDQYIIMWHVFYPFCLLKDLSRLDLNGIQFKRLQPGCILVAGAPNSSRRKWYWTTVNWLSEARLQRLRVTHQSWLRKWPSPNVHFFELALPRFAFSAQGRPVKGLPRVILCQTSGTRDRSDVYCLGSCRSEAGGLSYCYTVY